jgi:hypothetical protein
MGLTEDEGFAHKCNSRQAKCSFVMEDHFMKTIGGAEVKTHTCFAWAPGDRLDRLAEGSGPHGPDALRP